MADINLKTLTPDTSLPTDGFLFGADSQSAANPSVFTTQAVATTLLGSTALSGATVTTSQPVLNLSQTWNAAGVTFTGLKFNATDTASASGSLLLDLQVGGASKVNVDKSGNATFGGMIIGNTNFRVSSTGYMQWSSRITMYATATDTLQFQTNAGAANVYLNFPADNVFQLGQASAAAPVAQTLQVQSVVAGTSNTAGANFTLKGSAGTGTGAGGSIIFQVAPAGSSGTAQNAYATALTLDSSATLATFGGSVTNTGDAYYCNHTGSTETRGFRVRSTASFSFSSSGASGAPDLLLLRDAANTLALRNGTNAQTFNVYNTYTDASNYEKLSVFWSANVANIQALAAGTGTYRKLYLYGSPVVLDGGTAGQVQIASGSNLVFNSDNTQDIGASGANRPRYIYVASGIKSSGYVEADSGSSIRLLNNWQIQGSATGVATLLNWAANDWNRLNFGGTTSSFPALKRSSATLQVRLADDSANAALESASVKTNAPTGGTSGTWKLGSRVAATTTLDTTQYIEVDIGGTLYKLAVVTS